MPNMLDYLEWRGDLPLTRDALNENDELIMSQLSYVAFDGIAPGPDAPGETIPLREAAAKLLKLDPDAKTIHQSAHLWENNRKLLQALQNSNRFGDMELFAYQSDLSKEDGKQFAAVSISLGDGNTMAAFRGTDDSVVGWKEDLHMALSHPIPAQEEAVRYLSGIAERAHGPLRLCGHSKGGNLAVYAAAYAPKSVQSRILRIANHDGPGHSEDTIHSAGYASIRQRIAPYIPHFSIVGLLLEHENAYTTVSSNGKNIWQHDAFTWQMQGTRMVRAECPSTASMKANQVIGDWLRGLDLEQRQLFLSALFEIIHSTQGDTLADLEKNWFQNTHMAINALRGLDGEQRAAFRHVLRSLFSTTLRHTRPSWYRPQEIAPEEASGGENK